MTKRFNTRFREKVNRLTPASIDEIRSFLETHQENRTFNIARDIVRIIANTGVSGRELANLKITDVDFEGGWIVIHQRTVYGPHRRLPIRQKTTAAIRSLHAVNPQSIYVLGDHPRTRFDQTIRALRGSPGFNRGRLWLHSVRMSFVHRLMSARIPNDIVKYCLGNQSSFSCLSGLLLTDKQKFEIIQRSVDRFLEEL